MSELLTAVQAAEYLNSLGLRTRRGRCFNKHSLDSLQQFGGGPRATLKRPDTKKADIGYSVRNLQEWAARIQKERREAKLPDRPQTKLFAAVLYRRDDTGRLKTRLVEEFDDLGQAREFARANPGVVIQFAKKAITSKENFDESP